jgi:hypothetical protein
MANSHKTAMTRSKLSSPAKLFKNYCVGSVLDFGCGKGSDAKILKIDKYDPHYFPEKPTRLYDNVLVIYVLNTLEFPSDALNETMRGTYK